MMVVFGFGAPTIDDRRPTRKRIYNTHTCNTYKCESDDKQHTHTHKHTTHINVNPTTNNTHTHTHTHQQQQQPH